MGPHPCTRSPSPSHSDFLAAASKLGSGAFHMHFHSFSTDKPPDMSKWDFFFFFERASSLACAHGGRAEGGESLCRLILPKLPRNEPL